MRIILQRLSEIRAEQLKTRGQEQRISEVGDMYRFLDRGLTGLHLTETGFDGPESKLEEVMTSSDFTYALGEFVQRLALPAYNTKRFNFEPLVYQDTAPNYQYVTRYQQRSSLEDLEYVMEKGEPMAGHVVDAVRRQLKVEVWEKQFDFSMRAIVDDDIGYFNNMAGDMGQSARRTLERFVSRLYNNATSIARLVGLGANYSTTGRLTSTRVSTAQLAFAARTDTTGSPINVTPRYLVVPTGLLHTARQILNSELVPELATNGINVVRGSFEIIEDPHIAFTAPNIPWWMMSDPRGGENVRGLVLIRRQGMPAPMVIRKKSDQETFSSFAGTGAPVSPLFGDFATGNIVLKVYDEWGTYVDSVEGNWFNTMGGYYSSGTVA
jgi:hypothetical protein